MKTYKRIKGTNGEIPAVVWGAPSKDILIAVHGSMSHKEDALIDLIARDAIQKGYQVVSFDLPEHGERKGTDVQCIPKNCVKDLQSVYVYTKERSKHISLFGCSLGVYFSLLAYGTYALKQSFFLSPVVNMETLIINMMTGFQITEERLRAEKRIELPIGETLDWEYLTYVRENPVDLNGTAPIHILYGAKDTLCSQKDILDFGSKYGANITIDDQGEHFYHTNEQLNTVSNWFTGGLLLE